MRRTLAIVRAQLRASVALALQYRVEFLAEGALAILWMAVALVPLQFHVLRRSRPRSRPRRARFTNRPTRYNAIRNCLLPTGRHQS